MIDHKAFIAANTDVLTPPLVPEVKLHLAHESLPIWQKTEEELGEIGLPPPFWAFAWAGGQALARYVLDHPDVVRGRRVLDLASGSGLVAIAAIQAGASSVLAADIDAFSIAAIQVNASLNNISKGLSVAGNNLLEHDAPPVDVILVGDLFYEKGLAERVYNWLSASRAEIYIGDPGRSYLPKEKLTPIAHYEVPVTRELEDAEIKKTAVWRLLD